MPRSLRKRLASLLAGAPMLALGIPPSAHAAREDIVYAACYIFTAAGDHTAISFAPHKITQGELYRINTESKLYYAGVVTANGYYSARCHSFETPEKAEAWYRESGYNMVKRLEWPKGYWPGDGPPLLVWQWCEGSRDRSYNVYVYGPYQVNPDHSSPDASVVAAIGDTTPRCSMELSPSAAEEHIRRAFTPETTIHRVGSAGATAISKPAPKAAQTASLTVKTDTSLRDAGKAWDEQVKKTLAAEAQKKVETAAKQVQADAKYKAQVEAFFAERRKQGRAQ